jgi:DNA-binding NtrC family response regulator
MSSLLVIKGPDIGVKHLLGKRTTIGRAPENNIQVPDPSISRCHCEIIQRGLSYRIRDTGSKNGVLVNGELVKEKTLLRNDKIVIGSSTFLFNPDRDLKNTRFSNKRVHFSSPTDETILRLAEKPAERPPGEDRENEAFAMASDLICQLSRLFSSPDLPLPEALERILRTLMEVFGATCGCLLVWDNVAGEFVPMVVLSDQEEFQVSLNVIRCVLAEKRAVLIPASQDVGDFSGEPRAALPLATAAQGDGSALCVPFLKGGRVNGLIYLEIPDSGSLLLQDVRLLQGVADLAGKAVENFQTLDAMAQEKTRIKDAEEYVLIGASPPFKQVLDLVGKVAGVDSTVLLTGATGTGKEIIAREIHRSSQRAKYPFLAINCAAIPETLIESELFGHEQGAFTGADRLRRGWLENAHGGTLFLDEIGEMTPATQIKLLRFLQERVITRVGGHQAISVNARIIAATNIHIEEAVREKRFREDLWYRLNVFEIKMPSLTERREDIRLLADHFLRQYARTYNKPVIGISDAALRQLETHNWPGNIRELQNAVERAVLLCDGGVLEPRDFNLIPPAAGASPLEPSPPGPETLPLVEVERRCILAALEACSWNQVQAARSLQIHRNTLHKKIVDHGLSPESA